MSVQALDDLLAQLAQEQGRPSRASGGTTAGGGSDEHSSSATEAAGEAAAEPAARDAAQPGPEATGAVGTEVVPHSMPSGSGDATAIVEHTAQGEPAGTSPASSSDSGGGTGAAGPAGGALATAQPSPMEALNMLLLAGGSGGPTAPSERAATKEDHDSLASILGASGVLAPSAPSAYVSITEYRRQVREARAAGTLATVPDNESAGEDDDESDEESDPGVAASASPWKASRPTFVQPPMDDSPLAREREAALAAARRFVAGGVASVASMRRVFGESGSDPLDGLEADYIEHLTGWSAGWIDHCRGTAESLREFLVQRQDGGTAGTAAAAGDPLHGRITARSYAKYLESRAAGGATAPRAASQHCRWLARDAGLDIECFEAASRGSRKKADKAASAGKGKKDPKPAPPLDLDEWAHLACVVADTNLNPRQRGTAAQAVFAGSATHRYITAQRCGEIQEAGEQSFFLNAKVAFDRKKALAKQWNKACVATRFTVFGVDYLPVLLESLESVGGKGFTLVDFDARNANPADSTRYTGELMSAKRFVRAIQHLLCTPARYPDGQLRAPVETSERLARITANTLRHIVPAAAGATYEPPRAINEIGIWSRSAAEVTTVPTMGRLSDLISQREVGSDGGYAVAMQYASHGSEASGGNLLQDVLLRVHRRVAMLCQEHADDLSAIGGERGWHLLAQLALRPPPGQSVQVAAVRALALPGLPPAPPPALGGPTPPPALRGPTPPLMLEGPAPAPELTRSDPGPPSSAKASVRLPKPLTAAPGVWPLGVPRAALTWSSPLGQPERGVPALPPHLPPARPPAAPRVQWSLQPWVDNVASQVAAAFASARKGGNAPVPVPGANPPRPAPSAWGVAGTSRTWGTTGA